jgi:ribosome-binding factor A
VSERTRRVDNLLREEISEIIRRDVHDPRIGFVTVTSVDVTRDIRHATISVSIIGSAEERKAAMQALGRAMPFIRHQLGVLRLRRVPDLHLREDDSAQEATRVMQLLGHLEDQEGSAAAASATEPAPELDALPTPSALDGDLTGDPAEQIPAGYRRRVDRVAVRKARKKRGR